MLRQIIDAYGGRLAGRRVPVFANTGKEMPQTLDFVQECGERWNVDIVWLEYASDGEHQRKFRNGDPRHRFSRNGEPLERLLVTGACLPNPVTRFCTAECLCGRPHNNSYVGALLMWPSGAIFSRFEVFFRENAT